LLAYLVGENHLQLTRFQETSFGRVKMSKVGIFYTLLDFIFNSRKLFFPTVFKVDEAASIETLKNISDWFKTGHNVAVKKTPKPAPNSIF
jgi:hypothetical protein